ncbi:Thiamine-monophosphate kinase [compost metagenome]
MGALVNVDALPRSAVLASQPDAIQRECVLAGGDDYELCFTAPAGHRDAIAAISERLALPLARVGTITPEPGLRLVDADGNPTRYEGASFDHFASP